jgi:hypothetical protein
MSHKAVCKAAIIAAAFCLTSVSTSRASPVTYTFDGTGGVTLDMVALGDPTTGIDTFSVVFTGDTSAIDGSGAPYYRYNNITGIFSDSSVSEAITATIVVDSDPAYERVNFYNSSFDNGLGLMDIAALNGYQLNTSVGPVTGSLNPTLDSGTFSTAGGDLQFVSSDSLSFTASVSSTPLPATLPLLASGLGAMGLLGWHRKRKNAAAIAAA